MDGKASKYLTVETISSGICNGVLNLLAGYAIFHAHSHVPLGGKGGVVQDSIGETFFVTALSTLVPLLIARSRRKAGHLPTRSDVPSVQAGNPYLRSFLVGVVFTAAFALCNAFLLPHLFPDGASLRGELSFKTIYGTVLGAIATFLILHRALRETGKPEMLRSESATSA